MKERLQTIAHRTIAILIIISLAFILCSMLAGPLMIGWNYSFGLIIGTVTYLKCLKIIIGIIVFVSAIGSILNYLSAREDRNG